MGSFGFQEILLVVLLLVLLFGARRIPEIARGLGQGIRGFRASLRGDDETEKEKNGPSGVSGSADR